MTLLHDKKGAKDKTLQSDTQPVTRSDSLTNFPIRIEPRTGLPEDIRLTWPKKAKKPPSLQGSHIVEFDSVRFQKKNEQPSGTSICAEPVVLESEPFLLCGNTWTIKCFPFGVDEDSEYLSLKLQNQSSDIINAYYTFCIKRSMDSTDEHRLNMWVDPDIDKLYFQPIGHEDSAWGVDDFLPLADLHREELGYMDFFPLDPEPAENIEEEEEGGKGDDGNITQAVDSSEETAATKDNHSNDKDNVTVITSQTQPSVEVPVEFYVFKNSKGERIFDRLYIEVQMMVFGEVSLKAHPFTQAIEKNNATEEQLISIADTDLHMIKQATKGGGPSLELLEQQQDHIIALLLPTAAAAMTTTTDGAISKDINGGDAKKVGDRIGHTQNYGFEGADSKSPRHDEAKGSK
jgi:hypothetical protein